MSELLVLLWTARCLESYTLFLKSTQSPPCQPQLLRLLLPRTLDPVHNEPKQRRRSAWDWPNSTGFHVIVATFFLAATCTAFPAFLPCSPLNPQRSLLEEWDREGSLEKCPARARLPRGDYSSSWEQYRPWRDYNKEEAMHHSFWKRKQSSATVLCFRSPCSELRATPGCSLTCYDTAVTNCC